MHDVAHVTWRCAHFPRGNGNSTPLKLALRFHGLEQETFEIRVESSNKAVDVALSAKVLLTHSSHRMEWHLPILAMSRSSRSRRVKGGSCMAGITATRRPG